MPGEQFRGKPKLGSDIYSLGLVILQALTGVERATDLMDEDAAEIKWRHLVTVSPEFGRILDKMVATFLVNRYQSAGEVLEALKSLVPNINPTVPVATPPISGIKLPPSSMVTQVQTGLITPISQPSLSGSTLPNVMGIDLGSGVKLELVIIPSGSFLMGTPVTELGHTTRERPQHQVKLPTFLLSKYPVTQAQYAVIMGNNPSHFLGVSRPVDNICGQNAVTFCQKLSQSMGKRCRLPSEAEWEYACRAGSIGSFHYGETISSQQANYGLGQQGTSIVDTFSPNAYGLHDMHGNVWEYCGDKWHEDYLGAPTDGSAWIEGDDNSYLLRGGAWNEPPENCRSGYRRSVAPTVAQNNFGFRVYLAIEN